MKKLMVVAVAALAGVAGAADYVWTGNTQYAEDWFDVYNWTVDGEIPSTYPQEGDRAIFDKDAKLNVGTEMRVGELVVNANLIHRRDSWLTVGKISGSGKILLQNRGRLRNANGVEVDCPVDVEVSNPDSTACSNHGAMPFIQGNNADFRLSGRLLGDGHVFFTMSGNKGVRLAGDNSEFTGTVHVDGNNQNRVKFDSKAAGLAKGAMIVHNNPDDALRFAYTEGDAGESGTISFGAFRTDTHTTDRYPIRFNGPWPKYATLEIGANNAEDDALTLKMGENNWNTGLVKLRKVGTGTLEVWHTGHQIGTEIVGGTLLANSADALNGKTNGELGHLFGETTVTFLGGTLKYGRDLWTDPANPQNVTTDWSELVKNSTAAISVDTDGKDVEWACEAILANNPEMTGFTKKGEGTLRLSSWKMAHNDLFLSNKYTHRIEGGTLAIKNMNRGQAKEFAAKLLGTGTLRLETFENNAGFRFYANGALEDFEGTLEWESSESIDNNAVGFLNQASSLSAPNMRVRVVADPADERRILKNEIHSGRLLTFDAFDHLHKNAVIYFNNADVTLALKGRKWDSFLNGTITGEGALRFEKEGTTAITIGSDFSAPDGSTLVVKSGIFSLAAGTTLEDVSAKFATLMLADGVALAGEGMFGAVDLSKYNLVFPVTKETADKEAAYTLLTATEVTNLAADTLPQATKDALAALNDGETKGQWKLMRQTNADGTVSVILRWVKNAFLFVIR